MSPYGGGKRVRTADPLLAGQVLYQLSYTPVVSSMGLYATKQMLRLVGSGASFVLKMKRRKRTDFCID